MTQPIRLGAVLYDPKVSVIWDIIREFFEERRVPIDVALFEGYDRQVRALVSGEIDVAWHSPLAWLDTQHRARDRFQAVAMRDTDRDRRSHLVVKKGGPVTRLEDLRKKTVAMGAKDSPQATLIPAEHLRRKGLWAGKDYQVRRFDVLCGLHGDHVGGELEAFRCLARGEAAASCLIDLNWSGWTADGTIDGEAYTILSTTEPYDHCVFAVARDFPEDRARPWLDALFSMSYDDPKHRQMMDLEGLRAWLPGRTTGFDQLEGAVLHEGFFEAAR